MNSSVDNANPHTGIIGEKPIIVGPQTTTAASGAREQMNKTVNLQKEKMNFSLVEGG